MDTCFNSSNLDSSAFINHLTQTYSYKPIPLGLFDFIQNIPNLGEKEKNLWQRLYLKSDFYTHTISYDKEQLAVDINCSVRTIERRIETLLKFELISFPKSFNKECLIKIEIPKQARDNILEQSKKRIKKTTEKNKNSKTTRYKGKHGETLIVVYKNESNIYLTPEALKNNSIEDIGSKLNNYLSKDYQQELEMLEITKNNMPADNRLLTSSVLSKAQATNIKSNVGNNILPNTAKRGMQDVSHINNKGIKKLDSDLQEKQTALSKLTKKITPLAILGKYEEIKKIKPIQMALAKEISEMKLEQKKQIAGKVKQEDRQGVGIKQEKKGITSNLSQESDKSVGIPYYNNTHSCNKNTISKSSEGNEQKNVRILASPSKEKNLPINYTNNSTKKIPKHFLNKLDKIINKNKHQLSNPSQVLEEMKFAISRQFVGKPPEKPNATYFETMRFNTDVAIKKLKQNSWRTPSALIKTNIPKENKSVQNIENSYC